MSIPDGVSRGGSAYQQQSANSYEEPPPQQAQAANGETGEGAE